MHCIWFIHSPAGGPLGCFLLSALPSWNSGPDTEQTPHPSPLSGAVSAAPSPWASLATRAGLGLSPARRENGAPETRFLSEVQVHLLVCLLLGTDCSPLPPALRSQGPPCHPRVLTETGLRSSWCFPRAEEPSLQGADKPRGETEENPTGTRVSDAAAVPESKAVPTVGWLILENASFCLSYFLLDFCPFQPKEPPPPGSVSPLPPQGRELTNGQKTGVQLCPGHHCLRIPALWDPGRFAELRVSGPTAWSLSSQSRRPGHTPPCGDLGLRNADGFPGIPPTARHPATRPRLWGAPRVMCNRWDAAGRTRQPGEPIWVLSTAASKASRARAAAPLSRRA